MKLMKIFLCMLSFNLIVNSVLAQDAVIAVGEAQVEKEKMLLTGSEIEGSIGPDHKKWLDELEDLLKNDFAFYRHKIESVELKSENKKPFSSPAWDQWGLENAKSAVALKVKSNGNKLEVSAALFSVLTKTTKSQFTINLNGSSNRIEGHRLADALFQSLTGKKSIFLSKVFFVSDRTSHKRDTRKELYVMDFDGRRVERLTFFDSTIVSPAVSADNSKVMFSLIKGHTTGSGRKAKTLKNIDLLVFDLKTKKFKPVSEKPGLNSGAIYSADGTKIYYTMSFSGSADIYEMTLSNQSLRRLTTHYSEDVDPSITADGSLMTFLSNRAGRAHIYTMDPVAPEKDIKRISFVGQFNATPRFSPDGKEIVFVSWVDSAFDLYKIDSQGQNLARLTKDFGSNEEPSFSPDGEFIIFTSQRVQNQTSATQDIYLMNREGEVLAQLTQNFGRCFSPRWTK